MELSGPKVKNFQKELSYPKIEDFLIFSYKNFSYI